MERLVHGDAALGSALRLTGSFEIAVSGALGILGGVLSGFLGMGGAAVLPPLLGFALRVDQHQAQGISLAALLPPVGLPAVLAYRRSGVPVDTRLVVMLVAGFGCGAPAGAWIAHRVPARQLGWVFAAYLALVVWQTVVRARARIPSLPDVGPPDPALRWRSVPIGVLAGTASGLLGIGGAVVALPLLRRYVGLSRLEAQATAIAMLLPPIGLPAVWVYAHEQGGLPIPLLVSVAVGYTVGAGLGALAAGRVAEKTAASFYAVLLTVIAVGLLLR